MSNGNRKWRRAVAFIKGGTKVMERGVQDSPKATHQSFWIEKKWKSRNGVEYVGFEMVIDIIKVGEEK
jgi:hypothetical protein